MNEKTRVAAKRLNQAILDEPLVKEYHYYEDQLNMHPELKELEAKIKQTGQALLLKKVHHEDIDELQKSYEADVAYFKEHPLVVNMQYDKEALNDYLLEIESLINRNLEKGID